MFIRALLLRQSNDFLQMILRGTQINYTPCKSHLIIIIINTQGQIVQIHLTRKNEIYACN